MNSTIKIIFVVAMIALFLIAGPWLLFWSIGTISTAAGYPFIVPLNFWTWLAAIVFFGLVRGGSSK